MFSKALNVFQDVFKWFKKEIEATVAGNLQVDAFRCSDVFQSLNVFQMF
jgi:hypothetical protein